MVLKLVMEKGLNSKVLSIMIHFPVFSFLIKSIYIKKYYVLVLSSNILPNTILLIKIKQRKRQVNRKKLIDEKSQNFPLWKHFIKHTFFPDNVWHNSLSLKSFSNFHTFRGLFFFSIQRTKSSGLKELHNQQ